LAHGHPLILGLSPGSKRFIFSLSSVTKGGATQESSMNLETYSSTFILGLLEGQRIEVILDQLLKPLPVEPRLILPFSHSGPP